ncbi:NAD(P)/FAD-dependent oxidoreductase [Salegentibacter sp. F188]|uniref:NAD(P)/FAD-dependent oxidoreductase n=1 Tax=Autumnicola patrickiae TaxID=3075591 RepID=A0ABU3E2E6_9FLAO|nr:NAD(P)/FAD-dependent oxidoreductase [Salegentibacter sp. F188]MDT0690169.1 NAD(P)/FAD-dependent oxidoreductase [Salegentibacter sp. F188]
MRMNRIAIVGGGLAGLSAAIHLVSKGLKVVLFEKDDFPRHKVCGEYLSKEIIPYFKSLGISLTSLSPVEINSLNYSTPSGKSVSSELEMGGLGLSRYALDNYLYETAIKRGTEVIPEIVTDVEYSENIFTIITSEGKEFTADFVLGAFGKRSILDKNLSRDFIQKKSEWLAVKAHYRHEDYPDNLVSLHNFRGGYCGLSKVENGAINVCYLATYKSFKTHKSPEDYKKEVLCRNPHLNSFFQSAEQIFKKDITIAQVSFEQKALIENHILMLGDAAGLIHPLCGNGMAMAIHSAKMASEAILAFCNRELLSKSEVEENYKMKWNKEFKTRLLTGRILQKVLLNPGVTEVSQNLISKMPFILPHIIKRTHGKFVA